MAEDGIAQLIIENSKKQSGKQTEFRPDRRLYPDAKGSASNKAVDNLVEREKQRGFQQGYNEGVNRAEAEWGRKLSQLEELLQGLDQVFGEIDREIQTKTVEIAIAVANQIIRRELSIDSGQIVSVVKSAIDLIPRDGQQVNIHINPEDEQHVEKMFAKSGTANRFNIIQDPTISAGGCRASTDYSLIDVTVEKQLATIAAQIFGEQRKETR